MKLLFTVTPGYGQYIFPLKAGDFVFFNDFSNSVYIDTPINWVLPPPGEVVQFDGLYQIDCNSNKIDFLHIAGFQSGSPLYSFSLSMNNYSVSFPTPPPLTKPTCNHEWKQYVGFTNRYDFCVHCDNKREYDV